MTAKVKGFLAKDGKFFELEPECRRYEATLELESLCESHGINHENFMQTLNSWHKTIKDYYDADSTCKAKQVGATERVAFEEQGAFDDYDDNGDDIPAFLRTERDRADPPIGDKDAPGFLEQQIRGYK